MLYYSESGTTKTVAEEFQKQLNADIESIECVKPYTGNFQETIQRGQKEAQSGEWPELKPLKKKISDYDVIFLGYPIWFGTCANPIFSLLKDNDFAGKTIVPFCSFGSGGLNTSTDALKKALPKAKFVEGYGVRQARVESAAKEIDRFLKVSGFKKGTVAPLPDFSAQQPVSEEEKAIFSAACSSYQMPLGTPSTVGKRETPDGTEYQFTVKSRGFDGQEATSTIYVIAGKEPGAKPEFTQVVR
ncbi:MAG: hypothetical protein IKQ77_10375 [Prevotella sp.]|nr:hypothetical protein [Prevotella sp.]